MSKEYAFFFSVLLMATLLITGCTSSEETQSCESEAAIGLESDICLIFDDGGTLDDYNSAIVDVMAETISAINEVMPIDNVLIRIATEPSRVIPEIGIGGFAANAQEVIIWIDPTFVNLSQSIEIELAPLIAHELHHAKRMRTIGYGVTLLEASVSEGLADCFAIEITGISPPLWSIALTGDELENWTSIASDMWNDKPYDHNKWFFGTSPDIPRWAGYVIGFKLVKDFIEKNPTRQASNLFDEPADSFID